MDRFMRWLGVAVIIFIAAPLLIVVPMSFSTSRSLQFPPPGLWLGYYEAYFTDMSWLRPTWNSIVIASAVTVLTMALVVPATFALVRHRFRGKSIADLMMLMPLAVPHIVMAVGYYWYFAKLGLMQTYTGVILAHTALNAPLVLVALAQQDTVKSAE